MKTANKANMTEKNMATKQSFSLAQAVIASTLFVCTQVQADVTITGNNTPVAPPVLTSVNGNVTIASTGSLTGAGNAINVDSANAVITIDPNNANAINVTGFGIRGTGTGAVVNVGENANITGAIGVNFNATDNVLSNSGTILGTTANGVAVDSTSTNSILTNTGTIESLTSNAISSEATGLTITNSGTISAAIRGLIFSINPFGVVTNAATGLIEGVRGIEVISSVSAGTIDNQGTISSTTSEALLIAGQLTVATNSGTILTTNSNAVVASAAASDITGGFINSGIITAGGVSKNAIEFSASTQSIKFTNNTGGVVTGDVNLSQTAVALDTVFEINGGIINDTVKVTTAGPARTLEINGGIITGGIDLSASTAADVINQTGGLVGNIIGKAGIGTAQVLNILGPVTSGGTITDIDNITVASGGAFTITQAISGVNLFTNNDTVTLKKLPLGTYNISTVDFTQTAANTVLQTEIEDKNNFGSIKSTGTANITGSDLQVILAGTSYNQDQDTYTIIDGGTITGAFNIIQPNSQTLTFADISTASDVILQVNRSPFEPIADSDITRPPASVLDDLLLNDPNLSPEFKALIGALDTLSKADINDALKTLVPAFDGGMMQLSHDIQKNIFEGVGHYMDEHRGLTSFLPGYVAGDIGMGRGDNIAYSRGNWSKVFAARGIQKADGLNDGYDLESVGIIFGYDQYCSDRVVIGGALSYAKGSVISDAPSRSEQYLKSFQLTAYSTYDYEGPGYIDMMLALGLNQYTSNRNILAGPFALTARGDYNGWQYGVNLESGYRLSYGKYRLIPVLKLRYSLLQLDNYTETGAGTLGLSVKNQDNEEGITSIGIKFNSTNQYREATYVPELRFNLVYDWIADGQATTSTFLEGGTPFVITGIQPAKTTYNIGVSLTTLAKESLSFILNYDLDLKQAYTSHTASMKFRFEW